MIAGKHAARIGLLDISSELTSSIAWRSFGTSRIRDTMGGFFVTVFVPNAREVDTLARLRVRGAGGAVTSPRSRPAPKLAEENISCHYFY
jgi:hypothetical protein